MDFHLSEEESMLRDTIRKFVEEKIKPKAREIDEKGEFPRDEFKAAGRLGYFGMRYPEKYGGSNASVLACTLATEELARGSLSLAAACSMQSLMGTYFIFRSGKEELIKRFLVPAIQGDLIGTICMTEPDAGSDLFAMKTTARRDGDSYILNGQKMWITQAPVADLFTVFAKTASTGKPSDLSVFVVERSAPGLVVGKNIEKMGVKASVTAEVALEDCRVPAEHRVGEEGQGFVFLREILQEIRVLTAALALGVAQAALEDALRYANERVQFGRAIGSYQAIKVHLAEMATGIEAARTLTYFAAWRSDQKLPNMKEASMAKLFASEAANRVCDLATRIFGGYGYAMEYDVQRYFRDARFTLIGGGTSEILKMIISKELGC
jgi:alkylation response protein AidB-like acyl-CoA dehydrogenase